MKLNLVGRWPRIIDSSDAFLADLNPSFVHHKTQELPSRYAERALEWIHLQAIFPGFGQYFFQIRYVFIGPSRFHNYIINVHFNQSTDEVMKNVIHSPLVRCPYILQSECHDHPFKQTDRSTRADAALIDSDKFVGLQRIPYLESTRSLPYAPNSPSRT